MKRLLIIGAGGHGQVVREIAKSCGYKAIDFLDDNSLNAVGKINEASYFVPRYDDVIVGVGDNVVRHDITKKLEKLEGIHIVSLIHPSAYVSSSAVIGKGTLVEPNTIINTNSKIGEGCIISVGSIIDHDCNIGNFSHINAGAICMAGSNVKTLVKVNAGEVIKGF